MVIELKRDGNPKVVINNLYKHTALETSFAVNMLAIDHGRPKLLSLKEAISCYIEHRREVVLRRTRFLLRQAEERAETLEGYLIALANLDEFIRIIRDSRNRDEAKVKLLAFSCTRKTVEQIGILIRNEARLVDGRYAFSENQVDQILDLRLYQLTGLEREKIKTEYKELHRDDQGPARHPRQGIPRADDHQERAARDSEKARDRAPNADRARRRRDQHGGSHRQRRRHHHAHARRLHQAHRVSAYRAQRRGGKGVIGMTTREGGERRGERFRRASLHRDDARLPDVFHRRSAAATSSEFTRSQRAARRKGRSIANLLELRSDEKIAATIRIQGQKTDEETWNDNLHIVFATRSGIVKKSNLSDFKNVRKGGIIAIQIEEGDCLIDCA